MKGKGYKVVIDWKESVLHTRSAFANMPMSGCGAHKSKKDYDRKALKKADRKVFMDYK